MSFPELFDLLSDESVGDKYFQILDFCREEHRLTSKIAEHLSWDRIQTARFVKYLEESGALKWDASRKGWISTNHADAVIDKFFK